MVSRKIIIATNASSDFAKELLINLENTHISSTRESKFLVNKHSIISDKAQKLISVIIAVVDSNIFGQTIDDTTFSSEETLTETFNIAPNIVWITLETLCHLLEILKSAHF